MAHDIAKE